MCVTVRSVGGSLRTHSTFPTWAGFSRTFRICLENVGLCPESRLNVQKIYFATKRREERAKRPGFVGRMEKLGRRRRLEVRGGSGHHFPTSNVQQSHQANPDPTQAEQGANPKWHLLYRIEKHHLLVGALLRLGWIWIYLVRLLHV